MCRPSCATRVSTDVSTASRDGTRLRLTSRNWIQTLFDIPAGTYRISGQVTTGVTILQNVEGSLATTIVQFHRHSDNSLLSLLLIDLPFASIGW